MLLQNVVVALSLAAVSTARVSKPQIRSEGAMCFDAGDCILVCRFLCPSARRVADHKSNSQWPPPCLGIAAIDLAKISI